MGRTPPFSPESAPRGVELAPGHLLANRFEIRASLGEGALGLVYRAYDQEAEVEVALKTLRADLLPTAADRERAMQFGAQVARLNHPNLVRVFHVAEAPDGLLFFAMQLIEGLTLRESMAKRHAHGAEPVSVAEVEPIVSQIAAGLTGGYRLAPHGDLRPENVVMLPSIVKVADFGFASVVARAPFLSAAVVRGAGPYVAPEIASGGAPSFAADVFALGVITTEFLTGKVVSPGFRLRDVRPDLPESLDALLGNCLATTPASRIDAPDQLARGLRAHVSESTNAFSVATRARSMSVRQSTVAPAPTTHAAPTHAAPNVPTTLNGRFLSSAQRAALESPPPPRSPTGSIATPPPEPPPAPPPLDALPAIRAALAPQLAQDERSAVTHNAAVLPPGTGVSSLGTTATSQGTTVAPDDLPAVLAARQMARTRRPVPLAVWIVLILLLIGGATYGAIAFIDTQHAEAELALVEQQSQDRAVLDAERGKRDAARRAQQDAENAGKRVAEEARRIAEEAAKAAKEDPLKKAEAERLAKVAREKEEEQEKLEKKQKEADRKEAAREKKDSEKKEREEKADARESETKTPTGVAVTPPVTPPTAVTPPKPETPKETLVALAPVPEEKKPECPAGMARIKAGSFRMGSAEDDPMRNFSEKRLSWVKTEEYCMDRFEFPNQRGARPKTAVNWNTAKSLCEGVQKRLCTEKEWERACKGHKNGRYPYGDEFDDEKCNTETKAGEKRGVAAAGSFGGCRSQYGVFDLSGNAWEWTATPLGGGAAMIIKGGAANKPDWAVRCANRGNKPSGSRDAFLGFRCCANPSPQ